MCQQQSIYFPLGRLQIQSLEFPILPPFMKIKGKILIPLERNTCRFLSLIVLVAMCFLQHFTLGEPLDLSNGAQGVWTLESGFRVPEILKCQRPPGSHLAERWSSALEWGVKVRYQSVSCMHLSTSSLASYSDIYRKIVQLLQKYKGGWVCVYIYLYCIRKFCKDTHETSNSSQPLWGRNQPDGGSN